ncbi:MAG TPA: DUF3570 domain-containing protein [Opitutaceae bacterium]|nr:DUF3570 domain-containing protein [Opitutaceae bacterium]
MHESARKILIAAALAAAWPRGAHADDSIAYKYEDYREADGRVAVQTSSAAINEDLGTDWHLAMTGTIDAIAGATPSGVPAPAGSEQVPLLTTRDHRKAWSLDLSHVISAVTLDGGFAYSRESDYTSYGWSLNSVTEFNQNNTALTLGAAGTEDYVKAYIPGPPWRRKQTGNGIVGLSQVLGPNTLVSANVTWGRSTGFLSDQYKLVAKDIEVLPGVFLPETFAENRPNMRDHGTFYAELNQAVPAWHAAIDADYRYYADTYGIRSNMVEFRWLQHLGRQWILEPNLRLSEQSAARFYIYDLNDSPVIPVHDPNGNGPHYSSDYRLSALETTSPGLKLDWRPRANLSLDLAYNRYELRGTDGVTPQSAYSRAKITSVGAKILW